MASELSLELVRMIDDYNYSILTMEEHQEAFQEKVLRQQDGLHYKDLLYHHLACDSKEPQMC